MSAPVSSGSTHTSTPQLTVAHFLIPLCALGCLAPQIPSALALVSGMFLAIVLGNPYLVPSRKLTQKLLTLSVIGLGAGMDLRVVGRVGLHGIGYTAIGIASTFALGTMLGKLFKTERDTSLLIISGTAICGGSAIAAVAPTIRAKPHETSVALAIVFLLNALALVIFPWVGHALSLTQGQFGLWSALAIHDTSSVVGATLSYGPEALQIGTTVKLARALWIVPLTLLIGWLRSREASAVAPDPDAPKARRPWFILGFLAMAAVVTLLPELRNAGHWIELVARRCLVLTLFLIGTHLTRPALKSVGVRPFLQGIGLWVLVACATLGAIWQGWIA